MSQTSTLFLVCAFGTALLGQGKLGQGKRDAGGYPAPTPELERGRTVYVTSSCHFCHGIDLTGAAMGAANLATSALVGRDQNGNLIGAVVRAGLPNLQTSMPQYSDYTNQQIADLAGYVHYLRQQRRYQELVSAKDAGDANLGREYFNGAGKCSSCHSPEKDLAGIARKYEVGALRAHILRPGSSFIPEGTREGADAGSVAHLKALENYTPAEVQNVQAYLQTLK